MNPMKTADLFDHFDDLLKLCSVPLQLHGGRRRFCGPIATVRVFEDNVLVRARLEEPGEGRVLVVDGGKSDRCALLGDMLAEIGEQSGWAGAVIYGCVRDSAELSEIQFGVAATGTCPRKSRKEGAGASDVPVTFGGVCYIPGHWVYVDDDGVAVSEKELVVPDISE